MYSLDNYEIEDNKKIETNLSPVNAARNGESGVTVLFLSSRHVIGLAELVQENYC